MACLFLLYRGPQCACFVSFPEKGAIWVFRLVPRGLISLLVRGGLNFRVFPSFLDDGATSSLFFFFAICSLFRGCFLLCGLGRHLDVLKSFLVSFFLFADPFGGFFYTCIFCYVLEIGYLDNFQPLRSSKLRIHLGETPLLLSPPFF